jgi:membrane associated rhomboid family serine protease
MAMGIQDRDYYREYQPPWYTFDEHRVVKALIAINVAVFAVQIMTSFRVQGMGGFTEHLTMNPVKAFYDWELWRIVTAMFLHSPFNPFHLICNMFALWMFGPDVEEIYGPREFLAFYLVGGIVGNLAWGLTAGAMQPHGEFLIHANALGASGAVTAVLMVATCHHPNRTVLVNFFIPMPRWAMMLLFVGLDAFYFTASLNLGPVSNVAVTAHLGGALWGGLYYYYQFRLTGWLTGWRSRRPRRAALKIYRPSKASTDDEAFAPHVRTPASSSQEQLEAKLDAVLAKLAKEGKEKLSPEELAILQQASEIYRRRKT